MPEEGRFIMPEDWMPIYDDSIIFDEEADDEFDIEEYYEIENIEDKPEYCQNCRRGSGLCAYPNKIEVNGKPWCFLKKMINIL